MTLELSVVEHVGELERRRPEWLDLLERSETGAPTLGPDWLLTWWSVFGGLGGRQLRAGLFYENSRLVGLVPLLTRRHWYRSLIPFRRLELLGTGEDEADETCSEYVGILAERGFEQAIARALAEALAGSGFGAWDELVLPAMNGEACLPELLRTRLNQLGIPTTSSVTTQSPYIPLPATWEGYLAALSASHRALVKRSLRAFEAWSGAELEIECVRSPAELDRGFELLRGLHAERWGESRPGGLFASARFAAFHRAVMPKLLESGGLELLCLSVHGEPVAVQYNLVADGKVYFYQGGRKLDVPRGIRPGTVLHAHAIRHAIEAGRKEYDFLGGTQRYKLELALASRPIVELRAVRPVVVEAARRVAELGVAQVRTLRASLDRLRGSVPELG